MNGRDGWLLLITVTVGWDVLAALTGGQTMTSAFRRYIEAHPLARILLFLLCVLIVAHLFMPTRWQRYDPIDQLYHWFYRNIGEGTP